MPTSSDSSFVVVSDALHLAGRSKSFHQQYLQIRFIFFSLEGYSQSAPDIVRGCWLWKNAFRHFSQRIWGLIRCPLGCTINAPSALTVANRNSSDTKWQYFYYFTFCNRNTSSTSTPSCSFTPFASSSSPPFPSASTRSLTSLPFHSPLPSSSFSSSLFLPLPFLHLHLLHLLHIFIKSLSSLLSSSFPPSSSPPCLLLPLCPLRSSACLWQLTLRVRERERKNPGQLSAVV